MEMRQDGENAGRSNDQKANKIGGGRRSRALRSGALRRACDANVVEGLESRTLFANISGVVFTDTNGNGAQSGSSEKGLSGWTVYLDLDNSGTKNSGDKSATTKSDGKFSFSSIAPGTYHVREVVKSGYAPTCPPAARPM